MKPSKVWLYAHSYASRMGYKNDAEDFAQEADMKVRGGRKASVENLFIDYLREKHGRDDRKRTAKANEFTHYEQLEDAPYQREFDDKKILVQIGMSLKGDLRCVYYLRYLWGFTEKEIAFCFDVPESNIGLRLKKIKKKLIREERRK